jgi:hypothetical protein
MKIIFERYLKNVIFIILKSLTLIFNLLNVKFIILTYKKINFIASFGFCPYKIKNFF